MFEELSVFSFAISKHNSAIPIFYAASFEATTRNGFLISGVFRENGSFALQGKGL